MDAKDEEYLRDREAERLVQEFDYLAKNGSLAPAGPKHFMAGKPVVITVSDDTMGRNVLHTIKGRIPDDAVAGQELVFTVSVRL